MQTKDARATVPRWRWLALMVVVGVVLFRGALSAGTLIGQANIGQVPVTTAVLPTVPPATHQITPGEYADDIIKQLSLPDEIAQMLMININSPVLPVDQQQMIQQQHVGGALLFGSDITNDPNQLKQLTSAIQNNGYIKLFISTDQEGGCCVDRLAPLVGPSPGEPDIGTRDSTSYATSVGAQTAQHLEEFGLNFNLAPVVDITEPTINNAALYGRTYSSDPNVVADMANAYLEGLQSDGKVIGTLKHFPGLGLAPCNPDTCLPSINRSEAQLLAHEFVPYEKLIAAGNVQSIMVTHIMLPQIDTRWPATLSYKIITGLLRNTLGYQGLIVTDDLRRVLPDFPELSDIGQAALLSIEAGSDILIGPLTPDDVTASITAVTNAIQSGQLTKARIDQSVHRILTQKILMGLIPLPHTTVIGTPVPTPTPRPVPTSTPVAHKDS